MELLVLLALSLPVLLLCLLQKHRKTRNLNLPPGPPGIPYFGNLFQLDSSTIHVDLYKLARKYGPLMSLQLGCRPVLVVSSAEMAKEVMKTQDLIFCSRPIFLSMKKLSYNCQDVIFSPYDAYWREMRRIFIIQIFNANKVESFRPIREAARSSLFQKISESAIAKKPFNITAAMMSLTNTIACEVGFGKKWGENDAERTRFIKLVNETQILFTTFFVSDYFPILGFVDKLTGLMDRLEKNFNEFDQFYDNIIKQRLAYPNRAQSGTKDILDVLLQIKKDRSFKIDLTFEHIKAALMNVFVAGTDTSAATLNWSMTYLMRTPEAMRKAQAEVRSVFANKETITEDDVQHLPYIQAVVKEAMRLQAASPLLVPREVTEDCKLGGYDIKAKTIVHVNVYAIGREPEVWGDNPEEFYPDRFIGKSVDVKGHDYELTPFGAGRRICPGLTMGLAIVEATLANLVHKFDWSLPEGIPKEEVLSLDVNTGLTMHKKHHLRLMATPYTGAKLG